MKCEHEILEITGEPFMKGFSDFVWTECINCHEEVEVEVN